MQVSERERVEICEEGFSRSVRSHEKNAQSKYSLVVNPYTVQAKNINIKTKGEERSDKPLVAPR